MGFPLEGVWVELPPRVKFVSMSDSLGLIEHRFLFTTVLSVSNPFAPDSVSVLVWGFFVSVYGDFRVGRHRDLVGPPAIMVGSQ